MPQEVIGREVVEGYRPSPQQRRVWSLQRQDEARVSGATPYRAACAIDIEGVIDLRVLRSAVSDVAERQEVLRTTFRSVRGMSFPLQVVGDEAALDFEEGDIIGIEEPEQERIINRRFSAELRRPFDFERGPLLRCTLFMKSPDACTLIVSLHALCADTQSLHNLVTEITSAYAASSRGETVSDEPMQYVVISEIANDLLESEETRAGRDYWRRQSVSSIAQPRLPLRRESPAPFSPALVSAPLSAEFCSRLQALCAGERLSSFLLACWQAVLWRNSPQPEFVVGLYCDGRADEELRGALGPLGRCLPVRARLDAGLRFSEAWRAATDSSAEAAQWQDYFSWEQPAEGQAGYFSVGFEYEKREPAQGAPGLTFRVCEQYVCTERYDLKLHCVSQDGRLLLELHYDKERYDEIYAARLLEQLQTLARSAAGNVESPLGELEVIGEAERQQLLFGWNDTRADFGPAKCLHEFFEAQSTLTPGAVAVTFGEQQLTYSELDARSNQLARHLRTLGVGPETRVGVCVERSMEMVVGLLGVLKAGGAYVPLDPEYPAERIAFMLEDSGVTVLLTQSSLLGALPQHTARVVSLDADWPLIARQSDESPRAEATPGIAAYVIYTSGSTGRPKGVVITHRAISNHMLWMSGEMPLGAEDRVLQKTPLSFDASVWEFYAPLMSGARLVMTPPGVHRDSAALVKLMREESVTVVQVVPSLLRLLVEEDEVAECGSLRRVCVGGEALSAELVKRFKERLGAELYNLYGPTEATIDASSWRADGTERVTIGRPVSNARMYVVDEWLNPVPVGVVGEL
ncbi:MAG: amino acid adenylation domain-containing protein, partial [Acidobacteria bacterium]|nr:amino acid adenylation domain-containing protein [Acidobacteriota bacterium]